MAMPQTLDRADVHASARPWLVVFGSVLALIVCNGPMILFPFGVLVGPIAAEFGWPRATLASAVVVSHATGALAMPFVGGMVDRFGVQRVALPAICVFALVFASVALLPGIPLYFILAYAVLGIVGAGHSTLIYARAVSTWFNRNRGLALGITLSGVGLGTALTPQVARILIADYGWRGAYVGLGVLLFVLAVPAVAFLVRDRRSEALRSSEEADAPHVSEGMTLREGLVDWRFWSVGIMLFLVAAAVNGTIAHIVPLLGDRGVSTKIATTALSATGFALILGRILSGYCLDRFFAPYVSALFFLVPLCGLVLLGAGAEGPLAIVAAILLGIGIGAEVDIMAFLVGRYFGLLHYGAIYGTLLALFTFGSGMGPWLVALGFDHFHSYTLALISAGVGLLIASALVSRLGAYRYA
ncbi:MAG: MFS transporter [Methylobacteriaceae bacterium]|nr:MFS transporter [Methylobacteriaceae bacterium]